MLYIQLICISILRVSESRHVFILLCFTDLKCFRLGWVLNLVFAAHTSKARVPRKELAQSSLKLSANADTRGQPVMIQLYASHPSQRTDGFPAPSLLPSPCPMVHKHLSDAPVGGSSHSFSFSFCLSVYLFLSPSQRNIKQNKIGFCGLKFLKSIEFAN